MPPANRLGLAIKEHAMLRGAFLPPHPESSLKIAQSLEAITRTHQIDQ